MTPSSMNCTAMSTYVSFDFDHVPNVPKWIFFTVGFTYLESPTDDEQCIYNANALRDWNDTSPDRHSCELTRHYRNVTN